MKLSDLSPENVKLELNGKEYGLEYTFRSLRELELAYGGEPEYMEAVKRFMFDLPNVKRQDFVNFLFAALLNTDFFPVNLVDKRQLPWRINREGAKEHIESLLVPKQTPWYAMAIIAAWATSSINEEMNEILEVMAAGQEKKTVAEGHDGPVVTHS